MAKAINTIGTVLEIAEVPDLYSFLDLIPIKEYPDMGGSPELLETTDLTDEAQTHVLGVQSNPGLEFTANYTQDSFLAVVEKARADYWYMVEKKSGEEGMFVFSGQHETWLAGAGVNAVPECKIMVAPSSKVAFWNQNLIVDGIFANSFTNWTNNGAELDAVVYKHGVRSAKIDATAEIADFYTSVTLTPGLKYRIGFWVRKTSGTGISVEFDGTKIFSTAEFAGLTADTWTYVTVTDITGTGAKTLRLGAIESATAVANFDGISVIEYI